MGRRGANYAATVSGQSKSDKLLQAEIMVFEATSSKPIYHAKVDELVVALLPAARAGGYIVLDQ